MTKTKTPLSVLLKPSDKPRPDSLKRAKVKVKKESATCKRREKKKW